MTTWILLRGLARESRHWGGFLPRLQAALGTQHQLVAIDLPGTGEHHARPSPSTVEAIAAACRLDVKRRGLEGPCVLVAMSLGAMVATQWERAFPGEVEGCVLINTSLRGYSPFWQRLRPAGYLSLFGMLWALQAPLAREQQVLSMTSSAPHRHPDAAARWEWIALHSPVSRANALRQLLAAARYRPAPGAPRAPVLLLASSCDAMVSPECTRAIAARWDVTPAIHTGAGHDLPLDDPAWVVRRIVEWRAAQACQ